MVNLTKNEPGRVPGLVSAKNGYSTQQVFIRAHFTGPITIQRISCMLLSHLLALSRNSGVSGLMPCRGRHTSISILSTTFQAHPALTDTQEYLTRR
jgi:hypothetical protein